MSEDSVENLEKELEELRDTKRYLKPPTISIGLSVFIMIAACLLNMVPSGPELTLVFIFIGFLGFIGMIVGFIQKKIYQEKVEKCNASIRQIKGQLADIQEKVEE